MLGLLPTANEHTLTVSFWYSTFHMTIRKQFPPFSEDQQGSGTAAQNFHLAIASGVTNNKRKHTRQSGKTATDSAGWWARLPVFPGTSKAIQRFHVMDSQEQWLSKKILRAAFRDSGAPLQLLPSCRPEAMLTRTKMYCTSSKFETVALWTVLLRMKRQRKY